MKKKIIALVLASSLMSGGIAGAAVYHITDAAARVKGEVDTTFNDYQERKQELIKADTSSMTQEEIKRLEAEVWEHYNQRQAEDYNSALNEKAAEIKFMTDQHILELQKYIDRLFEVDGQPKG